MVNDTATAQPVVASSRTAARLAVAAAGAFLVLLAMLHILKPELDPSWRMISEYTIGRHGWVMVLAFLVLAVSDVSLVAAIHAQLQTIGGKIGVALLLVSALGTTIAAIFPTDPITIRQDAVTATGRLHGVGALLGIPTFPIAATLISLSLARSHAWSSARRPLAFMVSVVWLSLAVFAVAMATMFKGTFGPDVLIGWPNRLLMVAYSGWLLTVAWYAIQVDRRQ